MELTTEQKARLEEIEELRVINQDNDLLSLAVEDWGLYNNGIVVCKWWNSNDTLEDIEEYYKLLRVINDVEDFEEVELFAADIENDTLNIYDDSKSISSYFEIYEEIEMLDDVEKNKINVLMEYFGQSLEDAQYNMDEIICYENMDMEDIAEEYVDICFSLGDFERRYFDFKSLAYDMELDGNFVNVDGCIYEYRG